jgi:hypothetical protein
MITCVDVEEGDWAAGSENDEGREDDWERGGRDRR